MSVFDGLNLYVNSITKKWFLPQDARKYNTTIVCWVIVWKHLPVLWMPYIKKRYQNLFLCQNQSNVPPPILLKPIKPHITKRSRYDKALRWPPF